MLHDNRKWNAAFQAADDLANVLAGELSSPLGKPNPRHQTFALCTAFRCGDLVLVNDSISEDGAQEYAVLAPRSKLRQEDGDDGYVQIDSWTVSWMNPQRIRHLLGFEQGRVDDPTSQFYTHGEIDEERITEDPNHVCDECR